MARLPSLLVLASLAALALAAQPASAAEPIPTGCEGTGLGDHDDDGVPEVSGSCTTPPCGCYCPYAGAGVELVALDQEADAALVVGCGYWLGYGVDPNDVDWDGGASAVPQVYCFDAGLPDVCALPAAIALP